VNISGDEALVNVKATVLSRSCVENHARSAETSLGAAGTSARATPAGDKADFISVGWAVAARSGVRTPGLADDTLA